MADQIEQSAPLANPLPVVCRRLGISKSKLYLMIQRGDIRAIRIGGRTLIAESELHRFIQERIDEGAAGLAGAA